MLAQFIETLLSLGFIGLVIVVLIIEALPIRRIRKIVYSILEDEQKYWKEIAREKYVKT